MRTNARQRGRRQWRRGTAVRDRRGRPELAIAMVRDLSQIKRSEHERRFFEFMFS